MIRLATLALILTALTAGAASQEMIMRSVWGKRGVVVSAVDSNLYFYSTGHAANWTAPYMTASQTNMTWINPVGFSTNTVAPGINFFTNAGIYTITCPDWSKVTRMVFYSGAASRNYLTNMANVAYVSTRLSGLTSMDNMYRDQTLYPKTADWDLSQLTNVTTLYYAWYGCTGLTNAPDVNTLTNVTTLGGAWRGCTGLKTAPAVNALTEVTTLDKAWYGCTGLTNAPDVNTLTNVTTLYYAWRGCTGLTNAPAVNALTKVTTLSSAWHSCSGLTNAPDVNTLTKVTTLYYAWYGCTGLKTAPAVNALTEVTTLSAAWYSCSGLTNTLDSIFGGYTSLTNITTSQNAFYNCYRMSGVGSNFVNAIKHPTYSVGTATNNSSYRTFYNCTNLTDYATIPAAYK